MRITALACILLAGAAALGGCAAPLEPLHLVEPTFSFARDGDDRTASSSPAFEEPIASAPTR